MDRQDIVTIGLNDLINSSRIFTIADFQRDYEWTAPRAVTLVANLVDDMFRDAGAYLGTLCVYRTDPDRVGVFDVVDGQQRIITLVLAAIASRHVAGERELHLNSVMEVHSGGVSPTPRVRFPSTPGADAALGAIGAVGLNERGFQKTKKELQQMEPTARCLWENVEALRAWISKRFADRPEDLAQLWPRLFDRVRFTLLIEPSRAAAIRYFERANTTVQPLQQSALIKNTVISSGDRLVVSATCAGAKTVTEKIVEGWKTIASVVGTKQTSKADAVMHHVLNGLYGSPAAPIRRISMFGWVNDNRARPDVAIDSDPLAFTQKLADGAQALARFEAGKTPAGTENVHVQLAGASRAVAYSPIVVAARGLDEAVFVRFAQRLHGFNVLVALAGLRGQDVSPYVLELAVSVRALAPTDADGLDGVFNAMVARVYDDHCTKINAALHDPKIGTKTALVKSLLSLAAATCEAPNGVLAALRAGVSGFDVEHVFPRSGAKGESVWNGRLDGEGSPSPALVDALGNLTLMTSAKNRSTKDQSYVEKRAFYAENPLVMTRVLGQRVFDQGLTVAERQALCETSAWDPDGDWDDARITSRTQMLARRVLAACGVGEESIGGRADASTPDSAAVTAVGVDECASIEVLDTEVLGTEVLGTEVLDAEALGTEALGTEALDTEALGTEVLDGECQPVLLDA